MLSIDRVVTYLSNFIITNNNIEMQFPRGLVYFNYIVGYTYRQIKWCTVPLYDPCSQEIKLSALLDFRGGG